jgi:predicted nucleic acid-binding protein
VAARETVVDSSVVVKWFLPEPSRPEAVRLLRSYREQEVQLIAPVLLMSEVSNVFCKRFRRGELSASQTNEAFNFLKINSPILIADSEALDEAVRLAMASGQAVYDCLYLALALRRRCDLITADRKFHSAMAPNFSMLLHL